MTTDGKNHTYIDYNALDLPRRITTDDDSVLVNYCYLSDGSKAEALKADGTGLVYRGSLIYRKAVDGTLTLESAATPTGYLTPTGARYHITDHLGSVVGVVNGSNGALYQASEYAPYGERMDNASVTVSSAPAGETYRDQFTGKESQDPDFTVPYLDYGARLYSPTLYRWLTPDPLSEKYYDFSPYAYCAGNPVMLVDPDGKSTYVKKESDNKYMVIGGSLDNDTGVYIAEQNKDGTWKRHEQIGNTPTVLSFYFSEQEDWAIGSIIDLSDDSGSNFFTEVRKANYPLGVYMGLAQDGHPLNFKLTNGGTKPIPNIDIYRGMPLLKRADGTMVIASARDIGNIMAGYYAGANAIPWWLCRVAFDMYQNGGKEGLSTQAAQWYGWKIGYNQPGINQFINRV